MAKATFSDWSTTANSNTDVGGISIAEGCPPSNINNAIREVMAQLRSGVDPGFLLSTKAANYTAVAADEGAWLRFTASATLSLTAAATLLANWYVFVQADGGNVIIDPNAAETINGLATINLKDGEAAYVICDGTNFRAYRFSAPASYVVKTANYTALDTDYNASLRFTSAATLVFDVTANLRSNWRVEVWNDSTGLVVIDPDSTNTINGATTLVVQPGQRTQVFKTAATTFQAAIYGDPQSGSQLQGYIFDLSPKTNTGTPNTHIDISSGATAGSVSPFYLITLSSSITKNTNASWAVGTGNGSLDTGAIADTRYYGYLIQRSDTGVVDVLTSTSATSPTMPTNYDRRSTALFTFTRVSGVNTAPYAVGGAGSLIRQTFQNIDITAVSKGSTTGWLDTGISVTLPFPLRSAASRVRVRVSTLLGGNASAGELFAVYRDTVSIIPAGINGHSGAYVPDTSSVAPVSFEIVDTPATTTPTTYRLYWNNNAGGASTRYLGRRGTDTSYDVPTILTAEEIVG